MSVLARVGSQVSFIFAILDSWVCGGFGLYYFDGVLGNCEGREGRDR